MDSDSSDDFEVDYGGTTNNLEEEWNENFVEYVDEDEDSEELELKTQPKKTFFNFTKLKEIADKLRQEPQQSEEKDDGTVEVVSEHLQEDTYDPKDTLLSLISKKRMKELRKYSDNRLKPGEDSRVIKALKSSVTKNLENQIELPPLTEKEKKEKEKKADNAGSNWANLPLTDLTDEVKSHFRIVKNRANLRRDQFGKVQSGDLYPKYSVMGTILPDPRDRADRFRTKTKKRHLVDEVLKDQDSTNWLKRKYDSINDERWNPTRPDRIKRKGKRRKKQSKKSQKSKSAQKTENKVKPTT